MTLLLSPLTASTLPTVKDHTIGHKEVPYRTQGTERVSRSFAWTFTEGFYYKKSLTANECFS